MTNKFEETDLGGIKPIPIDGRESKVNLGHIVDPTNAFESGPPDAAALKAALPNMLAAEQLKSLASAMVRARSAGKEIMWLIGAHTVKVGLSGYLGALIDDGYITCLATTGSATIHDMELAFYGKTSEDVAKELPAGRFGMSKETSAHFAAACAHAADNDMGLGSGVGDYVGSKEAPNARYSVFHRAARAGVPATVHVAFGTDITHQHPDFPAAQAGELTMKDFRILTNRVGKVFDEGVAIIFGSAVVLPEVFLKAVSINYNLGLSPKGVTAASFDMIPQYRVRENVLSRPFQGASKAYAITGHHEIMLPLLYCLLDR